MTRQRLVEEEEEEEVEEEEDVGCVRGRPQHACSTLRLWSLRAFLKKVPRREFQPQAAAFQPRCFGRARPPRNGRSWVKYANAPQRAAKLRPKVAPYMPLTRPAGS